MMSMFNFGENWVSFSRKLDEKNIEEAVQSLSSEFGEGALNGKSFLDLGCGSGLFSIAAARLGARSVLGTDIDPVSVAVSQANAKDWLKDSSTLTFLELSVLDTAHMDALEQFDVVYAWGMLHHTGNMALALENSARRVKPQGLLMVSIYNRHWSSPIWLAIKWLFNRAGKFEQKVIIGLLTPVIFASKWLVTRQNPFKMRRGMDFMHNVTDWAGGYPYEYASAEEMIAALNKLGFELLSLRRVKVPTGCNEYLCRLVR